MAFAVVGIQAHYSKTLALFFLPQAFNFVLSCPQLFGLVPCPRHRVPRWVPISPSPRGSHSRGPEILTLAVAPRRFEAETQLLHPSRAEFKEKRPSKLATLVLRVFSALGLVELTVDERTGTIVSTTNLTILNVFLLRLGPMREDSLTRVLIATQVGVPVFSRKDDLRTTPTCRGLDADVVLPFCASRSAGAWWRSSLGMVLLGLCMTVTDGSVNTTVWSIIVFGLGGRSHVQRDDCMHFSRNTQATSFKVAARSVKMVVRPRTGRPTSDSSWTSPTSILKRGRCVRKAAAEGRVYALTPKRAQQPVSVPSRPLAVPGQAHVKDRSGRFGARSAERRRGESGGGVASESGAPSV